MTRRTLTTEYFGAELKRTRTKAGLSRDALGKLAGYVGGTIAAYEIGERFPQPKFIDWLDLHFDTDRFRLIYDKLLRRDAYPESFRPWLEIEREATALRWFELLVIPGLLQTEDYARALLQSVNGDVETRLNARLDRQAILERKRPPALVALISESALRQPVGNHEIMHQQLIRLAEAADRWIIQVVPLAAEAYARLEGSFIIATVDGSDVVYTAAQLRGYVIDSAGLIDEAKWRWDLIRSEALPRQQSKDLILEVAGSYGQA